MDEIWTLLLLSLAMLIGCYLSGLIPLAITFSEVHFFFNFSNSWSNHRHLSQNKLPPYSLLCKGIGGTFFFETSACGSNPKLQKKKKKGKATSSLQLVIICVQFPTLILILLAKIFSIILSSMICHFFFCFSFPSSLGALFLSTTNFKMNMNFLHQFTWIGYMYTRFI